MRVIRPGIPPLDYASQDGPASPSLSQKEEPWVRWESTSIFARCSGGDPLKAEFNGGEIDSLVSKEVNGMADASWPAKS